MPKMPDDSERAAADDLPNDPEADTEVMDAEGVAPTLGAELQDIFARLRRRHTGEEGPIPLPWPPLAEALDGGLWPGLHAFVGNPGAGKTQWLIQTALHAAQKGTPVCYIALEADKPEFTSRCLGVLAKVHWSLIYHGRHPDIEGLFAAHGPTLTKLPLRVRYASPHNWSAANLRMEVQALRATYPETTPGAKPLLVILDFLQIVGADPEAREELRERIGRAAYVGREVAREHNAAVLLVSSTAREHYLTLTGRKRTKQGTEAAEEALGKGDPIRFLGLGKESGDIEYAAATVIALTHEEWDRGGMTCHLGLAKVRDGRRDWVTLYFDGNRFTEPKPKTYTTIET